MAPGDLPPDEPMPAVRAVHHAAEQELLHAGILHPPVRPLSHALQDEFALLRRPVSQLGVLSFEQLAPETDEARVQGVANSRGANAYRNYKRCKGNSSPLPRLKLTPMGTVPISASRHARS